MLKNLLKNFIIENVIDEIQYININDVENDVENIIDEIHDEFEIVDPEIEIDDDEIVELFDLKNELKLYLINEIDDDDKILLINQYTNYIIFENDVDEFELYYGIKLNFNNFNYYNSNDDLIFYNYHIDVYTTINYHDIEKYYNIDNIIDEIFNNIL